MMTIPEVSAELGVTRSHLRRLVATGEVPFHVIDGTTMLDVDQVEFLRTMFAQERSVLLSKFADHRTLRDNIIDEMIHYL